MQLILGAKEGEQSISGRLRGLWRDFFWIDFEEISFGEILKRFLLKRLRALKRFLNVCLRRPPAQVHLSASPADHLFHIFWMRKVAQLIVLYLWEDCKTFVNIFNISSRAYIYKPHQLRQELEGKKNNNFTFQRHPLSVIKWNIFSQVKRCTLRNSGHNIHVSRKRTDNSINRWTDE